MERTAIRLVKLGGAHILSSRESPGAVQFKAGTNSPNNASPASDVDRAVEQMIRGEIHRLYPQDGIIGEELDDAAGAEEGFTWVIDPLDGTSNFLNGFPLYASTIGVLQNGKPVVGATWCATTHMGEPGVYHARLGSPLYFENAILHRRKGATWRGLAGEPPRTPRLGRTWDTRILGSSATECAYVAAGILRVASMDYPRLWDVAGGVLLARAAGCVAYAKTPQGWEELTRFDTGKNLRRTWRGAILIGDPDELKEIVSR